MNIAMEQTEEYVNGQLKAKYGDTFIRGNNGASSATPRPQHPRHTYSLAALVPTAVCVPQCSTSARKHRKRSEMRVGGLAPREGRRTTGFHTSQMA